MKLDRRRLLKWSALSLTACAGGCTGYWWLTAGRKGDTRALIVSILRRHLAPMRPRDEDLRAFADQIHGRFAERHKLAMFGMLAPLDERLRFSPLVPALAEPLARFEDEVVGEFLLSTNAFTDWPGEPTPIVFHGWRGDVVACGNPFAVFDEE